MKKVLICILIFILTVLSLGLTACEDKGETVLCFIVQNTEYSNEKSIYFHKNYDSVLLTADFEIQDGIAEMQIIDIQNKKVIWEKVANTTEKFNIELKNIVANNEYLFQIKVDKPKHMYLRIDSPVKLVKNKEKPAVQ